MFSSANANTYWGVIVGVGGGGVDLWANIHDAYTHPFWLTHKRLQDSRQLRGREALFLSINNILLVFFPHLQWEQRCKLIPLWSDEMKTAKMRHCGREGVGRGEETREEERRLEERRGEKTRGEERFFLASAVKLQWATFLRSTVEVLWAKLSKQRTTLFYTPPGLVDLFQSPTSRYI